jgi:5-methylcytosine-specific restriction endonuclease McrA
VYKDREKYLAYQRAYTAKNKQRRALKDAAYAEKHKEARNAASRTYYAANKERLRVQQKAYYEANKHTGIWRDSNKRSYAANKESYRARDARRSEEVRKQYSALDADEKWMLKEAYSLARLREKVCGGKWEVDHIVPLSKGGGHNPYNVQVVPQFFNRSKGSAHQARFFGAQE